MTIRSRHSSFLWWAAQWVRSTPSTFGWVLSTLLPFSVAFADGVPSDALEEVVVTAERRASSVQTIPISVTALSSAELGDRGVLHIEDLVNASPSLTVQDNGLIKLVNIRGVGLQVSQPTTSSGVAYHIDGMFIPKEISLGNPYYDLERIEVLRGPQGTLAGQNATGGAIFLVSKRPSVTAGLNGSFEGQVGDYGEHDVLGGINLPISDHLAARLALDYNERNSFTRNQWPYANLGGNFGEEANQPGNLNAIAVRPQLLWQPSDELNVLFRYEHISSTSDRVAQKPLNDPNRDPRVISYNTPSKLDSYIDRFNTEVNWEFSAARLRSLTGYQYQKIYAQMDLDRSSNLDYALNQLVWDRVWEQEFDLISSGTGPLQWVVGAFFMRDKTPINLDVGYHAGDPTTGFFPFGVLKIAINPTHTAEAIFGQATYSLTNSVEVVVGGRFNWDKKVADGFLAVAPTSAEFTDTKPTGKAALNWKFAPAAMAYVSASRGYKAGGIDATGHVSKPETINAYEIGLKSEWLSHTLRANAAAFHYDYHDFQLPVFDPASQQFNTNNIPKSTIEGFEADIEATRAGFSVDASVGYLHTKVGSGVALVDPRQGPAAIDVSGRELNNAPKWTASAGLSYDYHIGRGVLRPTLRYSYKSRYLLSPFDLPQVDSIPSTANLDFRLRYQSGAAWWVEGYATNLTDRLNVSDIGSGFPTGYYVTYAAPRQFGGRLGYSF